MVASPVRVSVGVVLFVLEVSLPPTSFRSAAPAVVVPAFATESSLATIRLTALPVGMAPVDPVPFNGDIGTESGTDCILVPGLVNV